MILLPDENDCVYITVRVDKKASAVDVEADVDGAGRKEHRRELSHCYSSKSSRCKSYSTAYLLLLLLLLYYSIIMIIYLFLHYFHACLFLFLSDSFSS